MRFRSVLYLTTCLLAAVLGHHYETSTSRNSVSMCPPTEWEGESYGQVVTGSLPVTAIGVMSNISYSYTRQIEVYDTVSEVSASTSVRTRTYRNWRMVRMPLGLAVSVQSAKNCVIILAYERYV